MQVKSKLMKFCYTILFLWLNVIGHAQTADDIKLTATVKEFHQALVNKNTVSINQQTDKALSYGHSNGWVETKTALIKDLESGVIVYTSFKEDSMTINSGDRMANVRFVADVTATLNGVTNTFHLKVLEVWVKKGNRWLLFGRQAMRA
jgi:hypothetical protein